MSSETKYTSGIHTRSRSIVPFFVWKGRIMNMLQQEVNSMKRIHDVTTHHLTSAFRRQHSDGLCMMSKLLRAADTDRLTLLDSHQLDLNTVRAKADKAEREYSRAISESHRAFQEKEAELTVLKKELQDSKKKEMVTKQVNEGLQNRAPAVTKQWCASKTKVKEEHLQVRKGSGLGALKKIVAEIESNYEGSKRTINNLVTKERLATSEIEEACELSVQVLTDLGSGPEKLLIAALATKGQFDCSGTSSREPNPKDALVVGLKWAGLIDESSWSSAFQQRYKSHNGGWELKMRMELSRWEALVRNPNFNPFKLQVGESQSKQVIDQDDGQLSSLKSELGVEVYASVTTALMEIEEHNARGRHPIQMAWNFEESRRASLKEVIAHLVVVINTLATNSSRKKARF